MNIEKIKTHLELAKESFSLIWKVVLLLGGINLLYYLVQYHYMPSLTLNELITIILASFLTLSLFIIIIISSMVAPAAFFKLFLLEKGKAYSVLRRTNKFKFPLFLFFIPIILLIALFSIIVTETMNASLWETIYILIAYILVFSLVMWSILNSYANWFKKYKISKMEFYFYILSSATLTSLSYFLIFIFSKQELIVWISVISLVAIFNYLILLSNDTLIKTSLIITPILGYIFFISTGSFKNINSISIDNVGVSSHQHSKLILNKKGCNLLKEYEIMDSNVSDQNDSLCTYARPFKFKWKIGSEYLITFEVNATNSLTITMPKRYVESYDLQI